MTAPDLTAMLRDTLADEGWCCSCGWPLNDSVGSVTDHLAAVLAATVRNWLGSDEVSERLLLLDCLDRDDAARVQRSLAALVQQIGDRQ